MDQFGIMVGLKKKASFEGWFVKIDDTHKDLIFSVIWGYSTHKEDPHAFIQFQDSLHHQTTYVRYPMSALKWQLDPFQLEIGKNRLNKDEMILDFETKQGTVQGTFVFGPFTPIKTSFLKPNIMGWLTYLPNECNHSITSMRHQVTGTLRMGNQIWDLDQAIGYIEKDWGTGFPMEAIQIKLIPIPVSSITVMGMGDASTITTNNGTLQMLADVQPATAKIKTVTWSVTAGTGTATIDATGVLTALTNGTVTVTATADDGSGITGTKEITISGQPVTPAAPAVTNDDDANTVTGMAIGMEYNLDGAGYVAYDATTFNALNFSGDHTLLVRIAAEGINPPSADTTLTFTTNPVTLVSIAITTPATKTAYTVGDPLDITGLVVTGTYSDASTKIETIDTGNITGFDSSVPAPSQTLTITFGGKTTTYNVSIAAPPKNLVSIAITTPATKTTYGVGETLNITGLVVTGTYDDDSTAVVPITTANISGFDSTAPIIGQTLTIAVDEKTTSYDINILKVVLSKTTTSMLVGLSDTLTVTVLPVDAPNKNVVWSAVGYGSPVTVVDGLVTGVKLGVATVTVSTVDGNIQAQCFVTVTNEANILNNFNLGRSMTYMPGLITQFGDAVGMNLPSYYVLSASLKTQVQNTMIYAPTFTSLADIRNVFDSAVELAKCEAVNTATVETMNAALNASATDWGLDLAEYNQLTLVEQEIVHGKMLIPLYFGIYYSAGTEIQTTLDLAVSNAPEAVTALAEVNDATVDTITDVLVANAAVLGLNLDNYNFFSDKATINAALDAQTFTNSYDLQVAIESIIYGITAQYVDPFNSADMSTIGPLLTDNAPVLGLDLTNYNSLTPAQQEIVQGKLILPVYIGTVYYTSASGIQSVLDQAVANAPASEIALAEVNAATVDTIFDVLMNNAAVLEIDMSYYSTTSDEIIAAQDFTNTYDLQFAIYGW